MRVTTETSQRYSHCVWEDSRQDACILLSGALLGFVTEKIGHKGPR